MATREYKATFNLSYGIKCQGWPRQLDHCQTLLTVMDPTALWLQSSDAVQKIQYTTFSTLSKTIVNSSSILSLVKVWN